MRIDAITPVAEGAVAVDLRIPEGQEGRFVYRAGQYLTLRTRVPAADGTDVDVRRSYSLVATPAWSARTGRLRVASREVPGGLMSTWLNQHARPGDEVGVAEPLGELTVDDDVPADATLGFVVAGSGITPAMSIVSEGLLETTSRSFVVIVGSRTRATSMFRRELLALADAYAWRMFLAEAFSREPADADVLSGRLDRPRLDALLETLADTRVHTWYTCGPASLVTDARAALEAVGVPPGRIRTEVFDEGA